MVLKSNLLHHTLISRLNKIISFLKKTVYCDSFKKNEEKWKFLYKKTIKQLKLNFFSKFSKKDKPLKEKDFINYYFKEASKSSGFPLDYFKDPLIRVYHNKKYLLKNTDCPKSINKYYFSIIFTSEKFAKDFMDYINDYFLIDCILEIPNKFSCLFKRYLQSDEYEIQEYIKSNPRCKLPWSFNDIKRAIQSIKKLHKSINLDKKTKNS